MEWTLDQYDPDYYGRMATFVQSGAIPPPWNKPTTLYARTVRGGSWDDDPKNLRSASRKGSSEAWKRMDPQLPKSLWYHTSAQFLGMRLVRPLRIPPVEEMHDSWNLGTKNVASSHGSVKVEGAIAGAAGNIPLGEGTTLVGGIYRAGGFRENGGPKENANRKQVKHIHGDQESTYDLRTIIPGGANNPVLKDGDKIIVPKE